MKKTVAGILIMALLATVAFPATALAQADTVATTATVGVQYKTHIQDFGWEKSWVPDGNLSGTVGQAKRLEALTVELTGAVPAGATIDTSVHVENKGNLGPFAMGKMAGTQGESLRMESIKLELKNLPGYTIKYNVHVENQGWLRDQLDDSTWFVSGEDAGTKGYGLRLEAIRIKLVKLNTDYDDYLAALAQVSESDYTSDSWTSYQTVVKANVVTAKDTATKIKTATANITKAQGKLVKGKNMSNYKAALAAAVEAEYTADTWVEYQKVLDANVVSQLNTQAEIDKATANILAAQKKLKRKVDFTKYREALAAVREPDFTAESWADYQATISGIVITEESSQTEVDAATQKIIEAQNKMVRKYDFSAYNALLEAVKQKDYTDISWAIYQIILGENVVDSSNTQSEIETAIKNIETAQKNLVRASDLTAYQATLSVAVKANYTTASWTVYQKVVEENTVTGNNTQAEVDAAVANIQAAQKKLIRAGIMTEYDELLQKVKQSDYTTKSWDTYIKVVAANPVTAASGQSAIDAAIVKIEAAQQKLVLRGDLTKYNVAINACKEGIYTSKTWAAYKAVLNANVRTYDDTQTVIDASTAKILEAQKALVKKGDLTAYRALIDAKALEQDKYTVKSWTVYQSGLKSNVRTSDNSQDEINTAITAITELQKALVIKGDLTKYNKALAAGEARKAACTTASWNAYQAVVKANVRTTEDTQAVIDTSTAAILDAQSTKLVDIAVGPYQEYLNTLAAVTKDDYRTTYWNTYQTVVKANVRTTEDDTAKIEASIDAIKAAQDVLNQTGLVAKDALAAYNALKNGVNKADYTADTWAEYQKVLALPANIVTRENSRTEIEAATAAIAAAQAKLIPVGRFDAFLKAIELYSYDLQHKTNNIGGITKRYIDSGNQTYLSQWNAYKTTVEGFANFDAAGKGTPNAVLLSASADVVDNATNTILDAKNKVTPLVDMTAYYTVVNKIPYGTEAEIAETTKKYTKSSLDVYLIAYNNVKDNIIKEPILITDPTVVSKATSILATAQTHLVVKPNISIGTKFGDEVEAFGNLSPNSSDYTAATWTAYEAKYNYYINNYDVEKNTQLQYDLAGDDLAKLRQALVYSSGHVGSAITRDKLAEGGVAVGENLVTRAQGLVTTAGYTGYTVALATPADPKNVGIDSSGKVIAGATSITISFTITENANLKNVTTVTITGLMEAKAAAAETALADYEEKSAAGVNFLASSSAADATAAKTAAENAITAYKAGGSFTYFDARKTAADTLNMAGQNIKTAYDAALTAKTAFDNGISATTAGNLKTALENLTTAAAPTGVNAAATATAAAANTYVAATKTAAQTAINAAFDIAVKNSPGTDGLLTITMPWVASPGVDDLTITLPTTGVYAGKIAVVDHSGDLLVKTAGTYTAAAGTAAMTIAPKASDPVNTYFGVNTSATVTVAMPIGNGSTPAVNTALTVSK
jgi:DNA-binding Lrp family transcriptional regulator